MNRFAFVFKRPLQLIPVFFGISAITFVLLQLTPGDPVRLMLGPKAGPEAIAFVRARYGLDQPIFMQYFYYLKNAVQGDFGQSIAFRAPVSQVILERIAPTIYLILYGLVISIALTLLLSISAARRRGRGRGAACGSAAGAFGRRCGRRETVPSAASRPGAVPPGRAARSASAR